MICGFVGGDEGKLSNSIWSYDIKTNTTSLEFSKEINKSAPAPLERTG